MDAGRPRRSARSSRSSVHVFDIAVEGDVRDVDQLAHGVFLSSPTSMVNTHRMPARLRTRSRAAYRFGRDDRFARARRTRCGHRGDRGRAGADRNGTSPTSERTHSGIHAELDALDPPWSETGAVARRADGSIAGVVAVELDADLGRAWIYGPWFAGDDDWDVHAPALLDAALQQCDGLEAECWPELANSRLIALVEQPPVGDGATRITRSSSGPRQFQLARGGIARAYGPRPMRTSTALAACTTPSSQALTRRPIDYSPR